MTAQFTDADLMKNIANDDGAAFQKLFEMYVPRLTPFIRNLVSSESLVDDVIQQTFLSLWEGRKKMTELESPNAYVYRVAANTCYKVFRRHRLEQRVLNQRENFAELIQETPEDSAQLKGLLTALDAAIAQLSPQRKNVYILSRQQALTVPQIADQLSLSSNTVRNTLSSALADIRSHLIEQGYSYTVFFIILGLF